MESTFLKIGSRIIEVQWSSRYSYTSESYVKWLHLTNGRELSEEEQKQVRELEEISCEKFFYPTRIGIIETYPKDATQIENSLYMGANDLKEINEHIKEHEKSEMHKAKDVYEYLSSNEIYS